MWLSAHSWGFSFKIFVLLGGPWRFPLPSVRTIIPLYDQPHTALVAWCGEGGRDGITIGLSEVQEAGSGTPTPTHTAALNQFVFQPGARVAVSKHRPHLFHSSA